MSTTRRRRKKYKTFNFNFQIRKDDNQNNSRILNFVLHCIFGKNPNGVYIGVNWFGDLYRIRREYPSDQNAVFSYTKDEENKCF